MSDARPSKQFILRGSIAVAAVAIILTVQTNWFRSLLHKQPLPPAKPAQTVGDIVTQDSNSNGIPDWEEKLWGLDPTVRFTNGVPNKTIIDEKKKSLGISDSTEPTNETDALARELLTITAALGQSSDVSKEDLSGVATKLADSVEFKEVSNHYSLKDLHTVLTTEQSLKTYYGAVGKVTAKYDTDNAEINTLIDGLEKEDYSNIAALAQTKKVYEQFARDLTAVPAPVGVEKLHLDMVNSVYGIATSLGYLSQLPDNGVNAFVGISLYKLYDQQLSSTVSQIEDYLKQYGIL